MKKPLFLLIVFIIIILTAIALRLFGAEDTWLCQNGQWVKHGQPSDPQPTAACGLDNLSNLPSASPADNNSLPDVATATAEIIIFQPRPGTVVTSPLTVKGQARGGWFFEASLPVKLVDANNQLIVAHYGTADSDWMTPDLVPFTSILEFSTTATSGFLIIAKDNPSGLPEYDASISWPVNFK